MILIISPAKKLDFSEETRYTQNYSMPAHLEESQKLINSLSKMSKKKIGQLMDISPALSELNFDRYQNYHTPFTPGNAKQALLSFKGEVYLNMEVDSYEEAEYEYEMCIRDSNYQGQVFLQKEMDLFLGSQSLQLSLPDMSSGIYLLRFRNKKGTLTRKILLL